MCVCVCVCVCVCIAVPSQVNGHRSGSGNNRHEQNAYKRLHVHSDLSAVSTQSIERKTDKGNVREITVPFVLKGR